VGGKHCLYENKPQAVAQAEEADCLGLLKGLSHEIDLKKFWKKFSELALRDAAGF
jgi:hypothetical protein